ncbi:hypothetical protein Tco_0842469 [Tanacetum coccineum]|uniref:Uncharacterized protein n=1 Tax=Tanacetum coccineum TaxID=301880 RepID=A0ABQ5B2U9_9ASTR
MLGKASAWLKLGEYEMWEIRIKQYFQIQDYALWEGKKVSIKNLGGRSPLMKALLLEAHKGSRIEDASEKHVAIDGTGIDWIDMQRMKFNKHGSHWHSQIIDKDWKEKFFYPANHVREEEPKKARENNDAPIIEDWVSDDEEEVEPIPKVERKTAIPTATKKESVKPEKPIRRSLSCPNAHKHMVPRAVLMKTGLKTVNNAKPVNTVRQNVNTARARGFNAVKPLACWVLRPIKPNGASLSNSQLNDKGFVDSGCSRHMSGNIAHLSDFKDFDGGPTEKERHLYQVYNTRTRKVQENLHIGFLENKPMIEGNGPKWLFDLDSLTQSMNYVPVVAGTFSNDFAGKQGVSKSSTSSQQDQDCIIKPIWKDASYFGDDAPRSGGGGSREDGSLEDNGTADQQVNTARPEVNFGSRDVSTVVPEVNTASLEDLDLKSWVAGVCVRVSRGAKGARVVVGRRSGANWGAEEGERSAEATTDDNGEVQITATIDGHSMSITEASLRRHLVLWI